MYQPRRNLSAMLEKVIEGVSATIRHNAEISRVLGKGGSARRAAILNTSKGKSTSSIFTDFDENDDPETLDTP